MTAISSGDVPMCSTSKQCRYLTLATARAATRYASAAPAATSANDRVWTPSTQCQCSEGPLKSMPGPGAAISQVYDAATSTGEWRLSRAEIVAWA